MGMSVLQELLERPLLSNLGSPVTVESPVVTIMVVDASVSITVDKREGIIGDVFTFSGTVLVNGVGTPGVPVMLYRDGVVVGSAVTDVGGIWSIPWTADVSGTFTFHAEAEIII